MLVKVLQRPQQRFLKAPRHRLPQIRTERFGFFVLSRFVRRKALKIHRLRFCLGEAGAIRGWLPTAGTEVHAAERKGCEREGKDPSTRPGGAKPGTSHASRASGCSLRMTGGGRLGEDSPGAPSDSRLAGDRRLPPPPRGEARAWCGTASG